MISIELAHRLRDAGVAWHARTGDRFAILQPEMTGEVFTISDMMIEAHEFSTGTVLGFNGTTEWALDSVAQDDALWLPHEDQLREMLKRHVRQPCGDPRRLRRHGHAAGCDRAVDDHRRDGRRRVRARRPPARRPRARHAVGLTGHRV